MVSIWLTKVKDRGRKFKIAKIGFVKRSRFSSNAAGLGKRLLAILLDAGGAQSRKAVLIDGKLPGKEFVDGQRVTAASLLKGEQAATHSGNDFGLTANNPPFGPGRGQIRNC
jgi:hypothetical protein